ncbi:TetR/AcrR family transcriptional regulator [Altererythrobacter sp. BO-6]|uniref:TetR/AcrR family transcriptional regulator n=1 Tax=Altererythrobacter sp. BO-6 TaxID=2604537 RepID=UPI0013E1083A|nr:TetR family transcriptional regulator [Altererythrobacter sp. BO-6]QIG53358.1 TetR/AcrR family transcriptional regulator [Altererythrobacter sp. BO-6]
MQDALEQATKPVATRKQAEKRQKLLAQAAIQINSNGAGSINLDAVAKAAGLSRNAIYYYVSDKSELAYLCLSATCDAIQEDLDEALAGFDDPALQISEFVRLNLIERSGRLAVLGDYDLLGGEQCSELLAKERKILDGLAGCVARGIASGRFRAVDPHLVANCSIGMINWVRLAPRWLGEPLDDANGRRLADAICELLLRGFAARDKLPTSHWPFVEQLTVTKVNPFDRGEAREQKRDQLLATASQLFNRRGIDGTSLNDIVAELGATKGVFYHYFRDKTELVVECYNRAFELYDTFVEAARSYGTNGFERALITNHLNCQAQLGSAPPLTLQTGLDALPESVRSQFITRSQKIWLEVQRLFASGVDDGSCRAGDIRSMTEAAAGTFAWLARGGLANSGKSAWELADAICDVVGYGILIDRN